MTRRIAAALLSLALAGGSSPEAQDRAEMADRQTYSSAATAILVDVVVRDSKGRPVTDLTSSDFEITEDGVPQTVDSFTRVSRGGIGVQVAWRVPAGTPDAAPPGPELRGEAVEEPEATTALVFDHLAAESLRLAQRATLEYVPLSGSSSVRVGVFAIGPGIRTLQGYTTDRTRIRQAVARIVPAGTSAAEDKVERTDSLLARRRELQGQPDTAAAAQVAASGGSMAGLPSSPGQRETELRLVQTELNMIRSFDNLDRDNRGYDTALALLTVVRSLAEYPGRKTIVFFSEGLPVSPVLSARLDHVIDAANRANVTAYAVDAKGLRIASTSDELRKEIATFAEERMVQNATGVTRTERPLTMAFERIEDTLTLGSRTGLARLARDTGGFLVEGSNDLGSAFRRIDEDHRLHYLLTYSPSNTAFDGKFREIGVKVNRPGVQVFARKGYRASRASIGLSPAGYERAVGEALERRPLPNAFPVHAAGFSFPEPSRPGLTPLVVQFRTDALRLAVDPQRNTYSGGAAVLVRLRDARGQEVHTLTQQYLIAGDAKDLDAAQRGEILFYREVDLPPGVFSMEAVVFDPGSDRASVRVKTLTVPDRAELQMSSLMLVSRIEDVGDRAPADGDATGPLYVGRTLLYPNVGEPIRKSATDDLPFYFALYGDVRNASARAELVRNGSPLAETAVPLPVADGARVQHVGRMPVGALPAGTYELRIRVTNGRQEVSQAAFFTLQD